MSSFPEGDYASDVTMVVVLKIRCGFSLVFFMFRSSFSSFFISYSQLARGRGFIDQR